MELSSSVITFPLCNLLHALNVPVYFALQESCKDYYSGDHPEFCSSLIKLRSLMSVLISLHIPHAENHIGV